MSGRAPVNHTPEFPFPRDPDRPLDPAPELLWLQRERPLSKVTLWNGKQVWLATLLTDARQVLSSPCFSASAMHENTPSVSAAVEARNNLGANLGASFIRKDPPAHTRERRMWQPFFNAGSIAALLPTIQRNVDDAIDNLLRHGSPADLVEHVATAIPPRVLCELLTIPRSDCDFFLGEIAILGNPGTSVDAITDASTKLLAYLRGLVKDRLAKPGDDLVSQLLVHEVRHGSLTEDEVVYGAMLIFIAGNHTTAASISLGALTLLQHPDLIAKLKADPSKVTPRVVEELLRYHTIVQNGVARVAIQDVVVGGETVHAGDGIIVHLPTANRDESVFSAADKIDLERGVRSHVAFGAGPHACIGQPLVRLVLQIVFDTLLRRIPTLTLAVSPEEVAYKSDGLDYGLYSLPVAW